MAHRCAFTSGASVGSGVSSVDCRMRKGVNAFIGCSFCNPSKTIYRCSCCYAKFSSTIKGRLRKLEIHHGGKVRREPAIDALLEIDWAALAQSGVCEHEALQNPGPGLFSWRIPCPSCYDFEVGPVESLLPENFSALEPRIVGDEIVTLRAPRLDHATGLEGGTRTVSVRVLSFEGVLTREQELKLMYRAADPPGHDMYRVLWQPHAVTGGDAAAERWQLVRSTGWGGEEAKALSLIHWNVLRGLAVGSHDQELGAALLDCVRRAAGFHQRRRRSDGTDAAAQSHKKTENVMRGPTPETCVRVNRVSGPFGHLAEGSRFAAARAQVQIARRARRARACARPPSPLSLPLVPSLSIGVRPAGLWRHPSAGGGVDLRAAADSRRRCDRDCAILHVGDGRHECEGCRPTPPRHPTPGMGREREAAVAGAS